MSHTQTKEIDKIALGSGDFYVLEFTGTIPADSVIETAANHIGRTKNGGSVTYSADFYTAVSDDGKARKTVMTADNATISYGMITWNGETLSKLLASAKTTESNGKRKTEIGGTGNDDKKLYIIRFVQKDARDGDIRVTAVGRNTGGWNATFQSGSETIITPNFECQPYDDEGHLLIYEEEVIESSGAYELDITEAANTHVTVLRGGSVLADGAKLNEDDVLTIVCEGGTLTVNSSPFTSGNTYTVDDEDVIVVSTAS